MSQIYDHFVSMAYFAKTLRFLIFLMGIVIFLYLLYFNSIFRLLKISMVCLHNYIFIKIAKKFFNL